MAPVQAEALHSLRPDAQYQALEGAGHWVMYEAAERYSAACRSRSGLIHRSVQWPLDGYTLLFNTANHASNKVVFPKLPYDPVADFTPISMVHRNVLSIAVHPSLPMQTLGEFLQYAKSKPGALSFGTPGVGTPHHLAGERLKLRARIDMMHIPYKGGGPAVADLVSGQIRVSVASLVAVIPFMRASRVRVVAITDPTRYDELPDVAAVAETFPGFDVSGWSAMFAPAGTPAENLMRVAGRRRR